jgi:hypothetical protein
MLQSDFINFLIIVWFLMGPSVFMETHMSVNCYPQKIILFIICGPLVWFLTLLKVVLSPFHSWMTKE